MSKISMAEQRPLAIEACKPHGLAACKRAKNNRLFFTDTFGNQYVMHWRQVVLMRTPTGRIRISLGKFRTASSIDCVNEWLTGWNARVRLRGRGSYGSAEGAKFSFVEAWWPGTVSRGKVQEKWVPYEDPFMIEKDGLPADYQDAANREGGPAARVDIEA